MDRKTLENQIFTWENWDVADAGDMMFYDVELLVQVGEFPVGTHFATAFMMGSSSMLALVDAEQNEFIYELKVSVGEKVNPSKIQQADSCGCGVLH